jgi:hypothetical protein
MSADGNILQKHLAIFNRKGNFNHKRFCDENILSLYSKLKKIIINK